MELKKIQTIKKNVKKPKENRSLILKDEIENMKDKTKCQNAFIN